MKNPLIILLTMLAVAAAAQRGVGTRAVSAPLPAPHIFRLTWTPCPQAIKTVIVSSTNLLLPMSQWTFRAALFNDLTNVLVVTNNQPQEFFRAYSE